MRLEKVIDRKEIEKRVAELGREISEFYGDREIVVIGILKGAFIFMADLVRNISIPMKLDFVRASSYIGDRSSGSVEVVYTPSISIKNEDILLVEDILDTGLTAHVIKNQLIKWGARSVKLCALIDRKTNRKEITADFLGFELEDSRFLVGYGLDVNEKFRYLPDVFAIVNED